MEDMLGRITFNKEILCGKPLIRGLRISVDWIVELLAKGASEEEILEDFPDLEPEDIPGRAPLCPSIAGLGAHPISR